MSPSYKTQLFREIIFCSFTFLLLPLLSLVYSHHCSASSWKRVSLHTRKVSQCVDWYPLDMSSLSLYLLRLWRYNAAKSILRRLGNACNFPGPVQYWRTESGERLATMFRHRSQAKSFKHEIRSRAGFLVPRYHCFTLKVENDKVFFPSLLLIPCNIHV